MYDHQADGWSKKVFVCNHVLSDTERFHAEMKVVRAHLFLTDVPKNNLGHLHVGASRSVCKDCSGWMTKHQVAHAPIPSTPYTCQSWRNPVSGATYGFEQGEASYYLHPGNESFGRL